MPNQPGRRIIGMKRNSLGQPSLILAAALFLALTFPSTAATAPVAF